jgi:energy-coupling factor transporter ATP-binding protein EcfA2
VSALLAPAIPDVAFSDVAARMGRLWDPSQRNPHVAVFGVSGSGKSHLIRHGLLPIRSDSRTVIIDGKSDRDSVWTGCGTPVDELPPAFFGAGDGTRAARYRLVVDRAGDAKRQVRRALEQIRDEGHCLVIVDESRSITEREQLGLGSLVENLILEGRGLGITLILGAQSTAWAVASLKDQPTTVFVGMNGRVQSRELASVIGAGRELAPVIAGIPARTWLYSDRWEAEPLLGMTTLGR